MLYVHPEPRALGAGGRIAAALARLAAALVAVLALGGGAPASPPGPKESARREGCELRLNLGKTMVFTDGEYGFEMGVLKKAFERITGFGIGVTGRIPGPRAATGAVVAARAGNPVVGAVLEREGIRVRGTDGYAVIADKALTIAFNSERGFLYAVKTVEEMLLESQLKKEGEDVFLVMPCVVVNDYPAFKVRALHIPMSQAPGLGAVRSAIDMAANARFNAVILSVNNAMAFERRPEISRKGAYTKKEVSEVVAYARERHMDVIPEVETLGHQEWLLAPSHPEVILEKGAGDVPVARYLTYDPRMPEVYALVFDVLDEVIEVFRPSYFHIGHDEAFGVRSLGAVEGARWFATDVATLRDHLAGKGIVTMMWGDMLKEEQNGGARGIYRAAELIPRDVVIMDWIYRPQGDYPSIRRFTGYGFRVMGATFKDEAAMRGYSGFMKSFKPEPLGMASTTWYYLSWGRTEMLERLIEASGESLW
jgi:hypothetical protein